MQQRPKLRTWCTAALIMMAIAATASGAPAGITAAPGQEPVHASTTTFIVTTSADSGPGTLRRALHVAQSGDTITFDPAVFPPTAPVTISPSEDLPGIHVGNLTIDASNAGVILDGTNVTADWAGGLQIVNSDGNTIRGLQISNFSGRAIDISGDSHNNVIGGDRSVGSGPFGQGNLLVHNGNGIVLSTPGASSNTITGNLIGTDATGTEPLGNGTGVWICEGANGNTIGPHNVIAHNGGPGINLHDSDTLHNTITQNSIHDNGRAGIHLWNGGNTELAAPIVLNFDLQARTITGLTCANCTVEVFSDRVDEGAIYEGQITADRAGIFAFDKGSAFSGPHVTATATDLHGNSSEFSLPTTGAARSLILQEANDLHRTILQPRESRDLLDNRIGTLFAGFAIGERYDVGLYGQGMKRARASINGMEAVGIDWSRPEFSIHPTWDDVFTRMADNGLVTTYMLNFWDKATYPDGVGEPCPRFKTEGEIERYLEFVRFIVGHFKGRVPMYEIWNEPDNMDCPQGIEVEDYVNLVKRVVPVIRQEYPEAKIVVGSTSGLIDPASKAYLFHILESEIMPLVDMVAWHPFYSDSPQYSPEYYWAYPSLVQEIKSTASAHGFEGEYEADELEFRTPENAPPDFPRTHSSTVAAKYHGRGILMHLGMDVTATVGSYDEIPAVLNVIRYLCTLMAGAQPQTIPVQIQTTVTNTVTYTFSSPNDAYLVALWTDGIALEYDPGIPATVTLAGFVDHKVTAIDVLHGFEQPLLASEEDGNLVIRDVLVKDYPILLRVSPIRHIFLPAVLKGAPCGSVRGDGVSR
jgi:parallel beta-helix repeat protein